MHYSPSIIVFQNTGEEIRSISANKLRPIIQKKNEVLYLKYLLGNWYEDKHWPLWGRCSTEKLALSETTVFVEAH